MRSSTKGIWLASAVFFSSNVVSANELSHAALADSVMASIFAAKCKSAAFNGQADYVGKCQLAGQYLSRLDAYMGQVEARLGKDDLGDAQLEALDRVRQYVTHAQRDIAAVSSQL